MLFSSVKAKALPSNFLGCFVNIEDRDQFYEKAVSLPGIYLPQNYLPRMKEDQQVGMTALEGTPSRVVRHWVQQEKSLCTHSVLPDEDSTFKDMALMEVTRGCIWACRFCTAGFIYRPPRLPDLEQNL